jgi:hypothetical protein
LKLVDQVNVLRAKRQAFEAASRAYCEAIAAGTTGDAFWQLEELNAERWARWDQLKAARDAFELAEPAKEGE